MGRDLASDISRALGRRDRSSALRRRLAGALCAFATPCLALALTTPSVAAEKDDRSFAKAADSLIQLFTGAPAAPSAPSAPRKPSTRPANHERHANAVSHVDHASTTSAAADTTPHSVAPVTVAAPVVAPAHVASTVSHPAPKRVASSANVKERGRTKRSTQGEDWLKESGPPLGVDPNAH